LCRGVRRPAPASTCHPGFGRASMHRGARSRTPFEWHLRFGARLSVWMIRSCERGLRSRSQPGEDVRKCRRGAHCQGRNADARKSVDDWLHRTLNSSPHSRLPCWVSTTGPPTPASTDRRHQLRHEAGQ
jgi:hypothetical protein